MRPWCASSRCGSLLGTVHGNTLDCVALCHIAITLRCAMLGCVASRCPERKTMAAAVMPDSSSNPGTPPLCCIDIEGFSTVRRRATAKRISSSDHSTNPSGIHLSNAFSSLECRDQSCNCTADAAANEGHENGVIPGVGNNAPVPDRGNLVTDQGKPSGDRASCLDGKLKRLPQLSEFLPDAQVPDRGFSRTRPPQP